MRTLSIARSLAGLIACLALASAAEAASPIPKLNLDLDTETAAVYHRERLRQNVVQNRIGRSKSAAAEVTPCGTVAINSNNSRGSVRDSFAKPSVTVVTGPVINASSCR